MKFQTTLLFTLPTLSLGKSLESLLTSHPKLATFHSLLLQFDLLETFNNFDNITVIAPTDQAYLDLANWGFNVSEVPAPVARALLTYHVLQGDHQSQHLDTRPTVVHTYLKPPVLTNVTNGAAVKLRKDHDGKVLIESGLGVLGGVEERDIQFDSGVLHTLNSSMVLPHNITLSAEINGLTRFLALLDKAGLVEEFESLQDVTIFIPRNDALRNVFGLFSLMDQAQLATVARSHVVQNNVLYSAALGEDGTYKSMSGKNLRVEHGSEGYTTVNGVRVVKDDIILYAGVAHVVDEVLVLGKDGEEESEPLPYGRPFRGQGVQFPLL